MHDLHEDLRTAVTNIPKPSFEINIFRFLVVVTPIPNMILMNQVSKNADFSIVQGHNTTFDI